MRSKILIALAVITASSGLLYGTVSAQSTAPAGDAKHGYAVYVSEGCYECHGYQGQGNGHHVPGGGGDVGPILAPRPVAYATFIKQLRGPRQVMPPYSANILSDKDAADVYAYLSSIPNEKDSKTIPLLNSVNTSPSGK